MDKISIHLVEISPALSKLQAEKLCTESRDCEPKVNENVKSSITHYKEGITKDGTKIYWYYSINDVPREFSIFVAHEFFDALPIHKFQVLKSEYYIFDLFVLAELAALRCTSSKCIFFPPY